MLQPGPIAYVIVEAFDQVVPDEFVAEDVDEYSDEIRVIACPCGDEPAVYPLRTVECSCGRFYLNLVKEVKVYRPEGVEAALPVREPTSGS